MTTASLITNYFGKQKSPVSDGTVRISGGNLNYRMLAIDLSKAHPALIVKELRNPVPFLILHGLSHTGSKGIIDSLKSSSDRAFVELKKALAVATDADFTAIKNGLVESGDYLDR